MPYVPELCDGTEAVAQAMDGGASAELERLAEAVLPDGAEGRDPAEDARQCADDEVRADPAHRGEATPARRA